MIREEKHRPRNLTQRNLTPTNSQKRASVRIQAHLQKERNQHRANTEKTKRVYQELTQLRKLRKTQKLRATIASRKNAKKGTNI
jgi:hypothetical protein